MLKLALAAITGGLAIAGAMASVRLPQRPVYFDAGQYSAVFAQNARQWKLQPLAGDDVEVVDRTCINRTHIPIGVWFVSHGAEGQLVLVAPASTILPPGYPKQIALRACDAAGAEPAVAAPPIVLAWLRGNVGAVLVDDN